MTFLVLCTGNSARSILLEHILRRLGYTAFSAGSKPTGKVHPQSLVLLQRLGFDTAQAASKSWNEFSGPTAPQVDVVITVCGSAANEECPIWPGAPITVHWGVDDPAAAEQADWDVAFQTAFDILNRRAQAFAAMPDALPLAQRLSDAGALS